jgi:hypothetical protein
MDVARSVYLASTLGDITSTTRGQPYNRPRKNADRSKNSCIRLSLDGVDRSARFTRLGVIMVLISEMDKANALRLAH